jgi:hypothetical protein
MIIKEQDTGLVAQLTGDDFALALVDVENTVLGYIQACDPASISDLMYECRQQCYTASNEVDFDKCNLYLRTLLLSEAVKELCQQRVIVPEVGYDGIPGDIKWDVTFRQA